jgi:hypothetical protein
MLIPSISFKGGITLCLDTEKSGSRNEQQQQQKSVCNAFSIEPDAITAQQKMVRGEFQNRSDDNNKKVESMMQFRKGRKEKGELSDSKSTRIRRRTFDHIVAQ